MILIILLIDQVVSIQRKKDYFTSALPFTQRGDDVRIPLYGSANLVPSGQSVASTEKTGVWGTPAGSPSPAGNFDLRVHNDPGSNSYSTSIFLMGHKAIMFLMNMVFLDQRLLK